MKTVNIEPEIIRLANGLDVILENIPNRTSFTAGIWVPVGSRCEDETQMGYSHFTEHMMFKGTVKRNYTELSRAIDRLGGFMNASTSKEITNYYVTLSSRHFETALDVLSDMFFDSTMPDQEFTVEKNVILEEIRMSDDNPDDYLFDKFYLDVYGNTPLGRPIAGTIESISKSTREELNNYYRGKYNASGSVLSIAGMLWTTETEKSKVTALIRKFFERESSFKGKPGYDLKIKVTKLNENVVRHHKKKLEQVHYSFALPGLSYQIEDDSAFRIFTHLMGGSMSSRLFQTMREKHGLCYSVGTFHSHYAAEGVWGVYCGTSEKTLYKAVSLMIEEIRNAVEKGPEPDEVSEAITGLAGSTELSMESSQRRAGYNARSFIYSGKLKDWREEVRKMEQHDSRSVRKTMADFWKNHNCVLTSLGNMDPEKVSAKLNSAWQPFT